MKVLKWTAMGMRDKGIGEYVELRDHEAEVARLAIENKDLAAGNANLRILYAEHREEVARLREYLEVWLHAYGGANKLSDDTRTLLNSGTGI